MAETLPGLPSPAAGGDARGRELKLQAIQELDRIAAAHLQWLHGYHRVLLCGEAPAGDIAAPDTHESSGFGAWYRQLDLDAYQSWQSHLQHIDTLHRRMHESAAELAAAAAMRQVAGGVYDRFAEHAYRFKTSMRALQMKLVRDVCLIDHLTGVWNRSSLTQRLAEECERMHRHGGTGCVSMMDIDHFKLVNDRHGHAVGDRVLQHVAATVQQQLRRFDSIFRYGGEEFLICLPRTSVDEAVASMERIRANIADIAVPGDDGRDIQVTASFGVAELRSAQDIEDSIEAADRALFVAKAEGRNRTCAL